MTDIYCDPCRKDGCLATAEAFCMDCEEYMCRQCSTWHRQLKDFEYHLIIMPIAPENSSQYFDFYVEKCRIHPKKWILYFCEEDDTLGCDTCISRYHRQCETVRYIPSLEFKDLEMSYEFMTLYENIEHLLKKLFEHEKKIASTVATNTQLKNVTKQELQQQSAEIDTYSDKQEKTVEDEVEAIDKENRVNILKSAPDELDLFKKLKNVIEEKNIDQNLFIAMKKGKQEVRMTLNQLKRSLAEETIQEYSLIPSKKIKSMMITTTTEIDSIEGDRVVLKAYTSSTKNAVAVSLDEILGDGKEDLISRLERKTQLNIDFGYREKKIPTHPFFPEMVEILSSILKRRPQIQRLILFNMKVGAKLIGTVKLTRNEIEQISRYEKENTHIVQLCTQTIGHHMLFNDVNFDSNDFRSEINSKSDGSEVQGTFADSFILNLICFELQNNNSDIRKVFPSMLEGDERPSLVCIANKDIMISEFRGFPLKTFMINDFFKNSIKAENSVEKESQEYKRIFEQHFTDINITLAYHSEQIFSKHSNIEAIRVSFVKQSKTNLVEICPCIVIYCQVKSAIPYGEKHFPQSLSHPEKSMSFKTDVRIGHFSLCPYFALSSKDWNKELAMGCSIGEINGNIAATLGPFVEVSETHETCFLTVRHLFPPFERNVVGVKVVQPADCDLPPIQQNPIPGQECGEVIASVVNNEIEAALVKIADGRKPTRGHFVTVSREELNKTGLSPTQIPTFDDGSLTDVVGLTITDHATRPILKIGSRTGLTKGALTTIEGVVKTNDDVSLLFNGVANPRYFRKQLFVDSFIKQVFCQPGDSGSPVFLLDTDLKLHCIGIVLGMMTDGTAVVTPINMILNELGKQYNNTTLKLKAFRLEQMEAE